FRRPGRPRALPTSVRSRGRSRSSPQTATSEEAGAGNAASRALRGRARARALRARAGVPAAVNRGVRPCGPRDVPCCDLSNHAVTRKLVRALVLRGQRRRIGSLVGMKLRPAPTTLPSSPVIQKARMTIAKSYVLDAAAGTFLHGRFHEAFP